VPCFTEAKHEARLGGRGRIHFFGPLEYLERTLIDGLRAHAPVEPGNRLYIMIVDIGLRVNDHSKCIIYPFEVRSQDLNSTLRVHAANPADGSSENGSTAVLQFITVHGGDDGVPQFHLLYGFRHAFWLLPVQSNWATGLHGAKATTPRADTSKDHKGGGLMTPALTDIRAAGLL